VRLSMCRKLVASSAAASSADARYPTNALPQKSTPLAQDRAASKRTKTSRMISGKTFGTLKWQSVVVSPE